MSQKTQQQVNRFSGFASGEQQSQKNQPTAKKPKNTGTSATTLGQALAATAEAKAFDPNYVPRGFKLVEGKADKAPRKPKKADVDESTPAVVKGPARTLARGPPTVDQRKPKDIPVGGVVIDPEEVKREQKAAKALQRHLAKQRVGAVRGDAVVINTAPKEDNKAPEVAVAAPVIVAASKGEETHDAGDHAASRGGWSTVESKTNRKGGKQQQPAVPAPQPARTHADPTAVNFHPLQSASGGSASAAAKGKKGNNQAKSGGSGGANNNSKGGGPKVAPPAGTAAAISDPAGLAPPPPPATATSTGVPAAATPEEATTVAIRFVFEIDRRQVELTSRKKQEASQFVNNALTSSAALKGGFFISQSSKAWSNSNTVDEPWMIETYYKAIIPLLLRTQKSTIAYPYWPQVSGPHKISTGDAEAKVSLTFPNAQEVELKHEEAHCGASVSLRSVRIPIKMFVEALVSAGELLIGIATDAETHLAALADKAKEAALSKLPRHLGDLVPKVREAAAEYFGSSAN